jgi:hypothetical protein
MKKFSKFITEAKETRASEQAKKLGLNGNGHGDWYNAQGEFVAKTVSGMLKFFNKGQRVGQRDIPPKTATPQASALPTQQTQQIKPVSTKRADGNQEEMPERGEYLTVVLARFNPPTKEHKQLFSAAKRISLGGEIRVYPSRVQDSKKDPLNPDRKIHYIGKMFPEIADNVVNNPEMKTIFDVLVAANEDGYSNVNIVVGSDRLSEIKNLADKSNGTFYQFDDIQVIPTGTFDSEKSETGVSSGMLRKTAADNNFRDFKRGMPKTMDESDSKKFFNEIRKAMGFSNRVKENYNLWEIAPELDYKNLRENYIQNRIFKIGDVVENANTGLNGKVIRRGTNYLICVTENDYMFKSWIKDVSPYNNVIIEQKRFTDNSGVPSNQRLVGTDSYRKYTMKMSNTKKILNFINKYRKNK